MVKVAIIFDSQCSLVGMIWSLA